MNRSETIIEIAKAICGFQKELRPAQKDCENSGFKSKYSDINSVWEAIREPLTNNNLCVVQDATIENDWVTVKTTVIHTSGEWMEFGPFPIPVAKNGAHGIGSATSYAKRYALCAALGITSTDDYDDDGNTAVIQSTGEVKSYSPKKEERKPNVKYISEQQVKQLQDNLNFYSKDNGGKICTEFWKELREKRNIKGLNLIPEEYFKDVCNLLQSLAEVHQGVKNG